MTWYFLCSRTVINLPSTGKMEFFHIHESLHHSGILPKLSADREKFIRLRNCVSHSCNEASRLLHRFASKEIAE